MRIGLTPAHARLMERITRFTSDRNITAWATGGFLRDYILGQPANDIDISIDADPLVVGAELATELKARFVVLDATRHHGRLVFRRSTDQIDLMPLRAPDIERDLRLRDYTIDALAAPAEALDADFKPLDPTGGLHDLDARLVRAISEACLVDDPLRLLRGVRIANQLSFEVEPGTKRLISRNATLINEAAAERQRDELVRIFASARTAAGIRLLDEVGLFPHVLGELDVTRGVEQPKEHYYDVFGHHLASLEYMDVLFAPSDESLPHYEAITDPARYRRGLRHGIPGWDIDAYLASEIGRGTDRRTILRLCALLHDVGKPETKTIEPNGRIRFFGHSEAGAKIAGRMMRRLRFPSRQIQHVRTMIRAHLRPIQMAQDGAPTRRAVYKFFRDTGDAGIDTLLLSLADHLATTGPRGQFSAFERHVALIAYVLSVRFLQQERMAPSRLVTGHDLMTALGLEPGARIGYLLEAVREAQATGEIASREEALALAERLLERERDAVAQ